METTTTSSTRYLPQITFDNMADNNTFLKLEDLNASSPSASFHTTSQQQSTPPPVIVHSKPAKKRKSWGQQLPEPTTALPPRKRAKTDDEKEQRRIERIKRNRAAAHNSRERKRQETDSLAVKLARANAELEAYRNLHGPLPASVVLPEVTLSTGEDSADTPAPSLMDSRDSVDYGASPSTPDDRNDDLFDTDVTIKEEPDLSYPSTINPPTFEFPTSISKPALSLLDPTQHSAVMLCDLPCRSRQQQRMRNNLTTSNPLTPATTSWWTTLFLYITTLHLQTIYKTFLLAVWSHSPSRMAHLMQASTLRLTSRSTTSSTTPLLPSRLTVALAQRNAATRLQQRPAVEVRRSATQVEAVAKEQHRASTTDTKAFEEQHGGESGLGSGDMDVD